MAFVAYLFSDAVILGASSVKHLEENLKSTKSGPLHEGKSQLRSETVVAQWIFTPERYQF